MSEPTIDELLQRAETAYQRYYEIYDRVWATNTDEDNRLLKAEYPIYREAILDLHGRMTMIASELKSQLFSALDSRELAPLADFQAKYLALPTKVQQWLRGQMLPVMELHGRVENDDFLDAAIARKKRQLMAQREERLKGKKTQNDD